MNREPADAQPAGAAGRTPRSMLLLTFRIGNDLFALEARRAVEVLPLVALKRVPEAPRGVAGIFNYRGEPVLAVDLCELMLGRPARHSLSTRIIVVNLGATDSGPRRLLGLVAERATEILRFEARESAPPAPAEGAPYLGPILMDARGMIQLLRPEHLPGAALAAAQMLQRLAPTAPDSPAAPSC